jgi:hypothetical protein
MIGEGIYCTSQIATAMGYAGSFLFNGGNH